MLTQFGCSIDPSKTADMKYKREYTLICKIWQVFYTQLPGKYANTQRIVKSYICCDNVFIWPLGVNEPAIFCKWKYTNDWCLSRPRSLKGLYLAQKVYTMLRIRLCNSWYKIDKKEKNSFKLTTSKLECLLLWKSICLHYNSKNIYIRFFFE